jgi:hypothetical protein
LPRENIGFECISTSRWALLIDWQQHTAPRLHIPNEKNIHKDF